MQLGELERLAANPNYKLSDKQLAKLEQLRTEAYTQKNKRPVSDIYTFKTHPTGPKVENRNNGDAKKSNDK